MANENTQWQRCLAYFKANVNAQEFQTWFLPIEFMSYNDETKELLLAVPSNYFFEMLDGQFKRLVYNVVWRNYDKDTRILYRIRTDSANDISMDVVGTPTAAKLVNYKDEKLRPMRKTPIDDLDSQLNTDYRFENFIEGESNKLPRSIGQSIAENPKQSTFNPLFIYGSSGVGKTHLLNAIGTRIKELFPSRRVLYVGAHQFTFQYTDASVNNRRNEFVQFYQTIDVLIIDDIQELAGQAKTQLAFFHIFNHLRLNGKQIILASDRPPAAMQGMEERLLTRFKWGLMAELGKPNQELCRKILVSKMRRDGLDIPDDVIDYITQNVDGSVRDLEGIVNALMAHAVVYNSPINLEVVQQIVHRTVKRQARTVSIEDIVEACCAQWQVSQDDVFSQTRKANIVLVRQTIMYLAQRHTKLSTSKIGMLVGGRNHATVLHAVTQVMNRLATSPVYAQQVADVENQLRTQK